jgi:hypothetical protein
MPRVADVAKYRNAARQGYYLDRNEDHQLENSLNTTNANVKADASALQTLQNTVTQQGKDINCGECQCDLLQASLTRRTVFTVTAREWNSANHGF